MRVFVSGKSGQLGHDLCNLLSERAYVTLGASSKELDIRDRDAVFKLLNDFKPDFIMHCAAYTAVDKAEEEAELCFSINEGGSENLCLWARENKVPLLYISTDYVFSGDGEDFYEISDEKHPLGVYGLSKLKGEEAVQRLLENYYIVRISWAFGVNGKNFIKTMLRLSEEREEISVVSDQIGSPTYTKDLSETLVALMESGRFGIYHATNEGVCSWAEFAAEIMRLAGKSTRIKEISTSEYKTTAKRPLNSRLSKSSLDKAGIPRLPHWKDALKRYLEELGEIV